MVTKPAVTPVTTPVETSTVATATSLEVNEPPVVPSVETVEVSPTANDVDEALNVPAEDSVIVKTTSSVIEQDNSSVKVKVYVKPVADEDVGIAAFASLNPVVGNHEKATPLPVYVPVKVASTPVHVEASP